MAENLDRYDLDEQDILDLEELKSDLGSDAERSSLNSTGHFDSNPNSRPCSAPSTPVKLKSKLKFSLFNSEDGNISASSSINQSANMSNKEIKRHMGSVASRKGWVTRYLDRLNTSKTDKTLDVPLFEMLSKNIEEQTSKIKDLEHLISALYDVDEVPLDEKSRADHRQEIETYIDDVESQLLQLKAHVSTLKAPSGDRSRALVTEPSIREITDAIKANNLGFAKLKLDCPNFEGNKHDKFRYKDWSLKFKNVMEGCGNVSNKCKLQFLQSKCVGEAGRYIQHLELLDNNYQIAINILEKNYLDKPLIRDELIRRIFNLKPEYDTEYTGTKLYLAEINNIVNDLKKNYAADFSSDPHGAHSGGYYALSQTVLDKLSSELQKGIILKANNCYPTFDQIYTMSDEVINVINKTKKKSSNNAPKKPSAGASNSKGAPTLNFTTAPVASAPAASAAAGEGGTNANNDSQQKNFHCRLCNIDGHSTLYCRAYPTFENRKERCIKLSLCCLCTSLTHKTEDCHGNSNKLKIQCRFCNNYQHISGMCPNRPPLTSKTSRYVCLSTAVEDCSAFLLPVFSLVLQGPTGVCKRINALLDSCSSRTYLSKETASEVGFDVPTLNPVHYEVRTFLGQQNKVFRDATVQIHFPQGNYHALPILVDDDFQVEMKVKNLDLAVNNFKNLGYKLSAEFMSGSDQVPVHALVGTDVLQFIRDLSVVKCMNGSAFRLGSGIVPFGNINHFLYPYQISKFASKIENNYKTIISQVKNPSLYVNQVLEPKLTYADPLVNIFDESSVERRIDNMLSCESLGISDGDISDYDQMQIQKFKNGIELIDGKINVELVWNDNIEFVPSNHSICLGALDQVMKRLEKNGYAEAYCQYWRDQESAGYIERFECQPSEYHNFKWLPHRPVFKMDEQSTTKIRGVFNASFKKGCSPSINQSSYVGVNLMADMCELLLKFRTNKHVLLADLKHAFLQIKLKLLADRNRFCFFVKFSDKLVCYRYTTIIFGYNSSPFILNYVVKFIADRYPDDECSRMIKSSFFVDNLVFTSNDIEKLENLYELAVHRFDENGFDLRSCNTNHDTLRSRMKSDGKFIKHNCEFDKVLGYRYSAARDIIKLAEVKLDSSANTKRSILSESSKVFDPLSLTSPVTVRGKTLISTIWTQHNCSTSKNHWDECVSAEVAQSWYHLSRDLEGLSDVEFPRYTLSEEVPGNLYLFCDASKSAYGFAAYMVQNGNSHLIFSKVKVAPLKSRTLPVLELLSVFLAFKCLHQILKNFSKFTSNVYISSDAQIVLSWLLSDVLQTKSIYTKNRVKNIHEMKRKLEGKYQTSFHFRYVPTDQNPADLLTRGLKLEKFKQNLSFWLEGPAWLKLTPVVWPTSDLMCLNSVNRGLVLNTQICKVNVQPVVAFDRFGNLTKLVNSVSKVIDMLRLKKIVKDVHMMNWWGSIDSMQAAKIYLIKIMQKQSLETEISFLENPVNKEVPLLVKNANLFIDKCGVVRSDG